MEKLPFDREFQLNLIRLILEDWNFLTFCAETVKPDYFEDKSLVWFYQNIISYYNSYQEKPSSIVLGNELKKAIFSKRIKKEDAKLYIKDFSKISKSPALSVEYTKEEIIRWCRRTSLRNKILDEVIPLSDSDDPDTWDQIMDIVQDSCTIGVNSSDLGLFYFSDIRERLRRTSEEQDDYIIPTGVTELDDYIGGGIKIKQLGLLMGGTGRGKSLFLNQVAKRNVIAGKKVVQISLELSTDDVAFRYDASFTKIPLYDVSDYPAQVEKKLINIRDKFGDNLVIKEFPTRSIGISGIRSYLIQLINSGWGSPDLLLIDYLDLIKPPSYRRFDNNYDLLGDLAAELRGLGGEFNCGVWTVTQLNRPGMAAEVPTEQHVAESFKKLFVCDVVASLQITREQKLSNLAKLFLVKNRNGPDQIEIKINTAYHRATFFDPLGIVPKLEGKEPPKRRKPKEKDVSD